MERCISSSVQGAERLDQAARVLSFDIASRTIASKVSKICKKPIEYVSSKEGFRRTGVHLILH